MFNRLRNGPTVGVAICTAVSLLVDGRFVPRVILPAQTVVCANCPLHLRGLFGILHVMKPLPRKRSR